MAFNKRNSELSAAKAMVSLPEPKGKKLDGTVTPAPDDALREGDDLEEDSDEARILLMKQENNNRFKMLGVCIAIACIAIIAVLVIGVTLANKIKNTEIKERDEIPYLYDLQVDK